MANSGNNDISDDPIGNPVINWQPRARPPMPFVNVIDAPPESIQRQHQLPMEEPLFPGTESFKNYQIARKRKLYHQGSSSFAADQPPRTTQMFYNEVVAEGDTDFMEVRWTSAVQYISESGEEWTKLNEIHGSWSKVRKLLVMIKDLEKNYRGDGMATVKDPTGTMGASIHNNVFQLEGVNEVLKVGAVLLLQEVAVGRFLGSEKYLNITTNNVIKVVGPNQMIAPMVILDSDDELN